MENQVLDAIFNRRSIRRYTDQPVSSDQLDLILKAGQAAPSAMNQQPWYFVAIQRKDMIEQLASLLTENEDPYYNAPLLIVVFADKKAYSPVTDAALAIANMMLAAPGTAVGDVLDRLQPPRVQSSEVCRIIRLAGRAAGLSLRRFVGRRNPGRTAGSASGQVGNDDGRGLIIYPQI